MSNGNPLRTTFSKGQLLRTEAKGQLLKTDTLTSHKYYTMNKCGGVD